MTTAEDKYIRRVKGLLAKAEGTDNEAERDAFTAKAFAIMEEHRIEMADVTDGRPSIAKTVYPLAATARYLRPSGYLLGAVAKHFGVMVLIGATGNMKQPTLVGDTDDITSTVLMFESLLIQRDRAILASPVPPNVNTNRHRSSMAMGFVIGIEARLEAMAAARAEHATTGTELVLIDRLALVREAMGNPAPANTNKQKVDGRSMAEGDDAGRRADLGQDRMGAGAGPMALGR
jgi:hypothetical protein